jgi:hypothetical protein
MFFFHFLSKGSSEKEITCKGVTIHDSKVRDNNKKVVSKNYLTLRDVIFGQTLHDAYRNICSLDFPYPVGAVDVAAMACKTVP